MKNSFLKKNKIPILVIFLFLIIVAVFLSINIFRTSNKPVPEQMKLSDAEVMKKSEDQIATTVETATRNYIIKTYPRAENITTQIELVGRGYGIINAGYSIDGRENKRKIYLSEKNSTWTVLHDGEGKITCVKVKQLFGSDSILSAYCD